MRIFKVATYIVRVEDEIFGCDTHLGWIAKWKEAKTKENWSVTSISYSIKRKDANNN